MRIQNKIFSVIIPLVLITLVISGSISALSAYFGLKRFGVQYQSLKAYQIEQYINNQWNILQEGKIKITESYLEILAKDIISFSSSLIRNNSEIIFIVDETNVVKASTSPETVTEENALTLQSIVRVMKTTNAAISRKWIEKSFMINDQKYIGYFFSFEPLNWTIFVTDSQKAFFQSVRNIIYITLSVIAIALIIGIFIIIIFTRALTTPINKLISSMHNIIRSKDLSQRVPIVYKDEVGTLSHTFNVTIEELEEAYKEIRTFAFESVLAKKQENKIRHIFQKYVPNSVINTLFKDPSRMLAGEEKPLAILFTDIRSFTTISESYKPSELVAELNIYFEKTVSVIVQNQGIIDKYIGDAIMAFFGAPTTLKNSSLSAVQAALEMQAQIQQFNEYLHKKDKPQFITGMGINYGQVTVGNIGSEHKMDYTVIGDAVNLASRLEGLTKEYKQHLIFSHSVCDKIRNLIPCRFIDLVQAKGKTEGEKIYTTVPEFNSKIIDSFALHNQAVQLYFEREFAKALLLFEKVVTILGNDFLAHLYIERCKKYIENPPPQDWNGVFVMTTK